MVDKYRAREGQSQLACFDGGVYPAPVVVGPNGV